MPKIPYKAEKSHDEDEDYEIVSFEDFCDKSPGSKTDLLTLNDNINYRLCYESDKSQNVADKYGEPSNIDAESHTETSLNGSKNVTFKRKLSNSFAPFGRSNVKSGRAPLFSGVIPKSRSDGECTSREHRYQRFSEQRNWLHRSWELVASAGPGMLGVALVCALCVGAWWAATGALGGAWGEEHYRKLWERAHPDNTKKPPTPMTYEKILPEYRYHDHNNLSTKNKSNGTDLTRKNANLNKKSFIERPPEVLKDICAKVEDDLRFDCFPQANANENDCIKRGCCWRVPDQKGNIPYCFYPPQYDSFRFLNMTEDKHSVTVYYERARPSGYPDDFETARIDFKYMSDDMLQIKMYDADNKRFEPPLPEIATVGKPLANMKYRVEINASTVGFKVIRNSNNVTIFDTQDIGGLILSDKFLQISALLSTKYLYGLGERRARFLLDMNWQTFALFNRDRPPIEHQNLYGTHPFFLGVEPEGNSFGVLLLNSNAMDIVLQPSPAITYRTVGGVLNFYVMLGPSPRDVSVQYANLVGRPFLPPYWSLGFHLCKFGYNSLNVTRDVWKKNRDAGIPFDVQWNDIDYMKNRNDFTYDDENYAGLPAFADELHREGMHYMILIDPGVSASEKPGSYPPFDRGLEMNVFVKNSTDQPFIGKVWNSESTAFPDFTHPNTTQYWLEMMTDFHKKVKYDGAWIDMNEPSNMINGILEGHCADERLPYMPHTGDSLLRDKTLCMDARQYAGVHYDLHNLYGLTEAVATNFALSDIRGKRPFIISRSTFVGSGKYGGHWSGDVDSSWHDMQMSIPELLNFNLFGIPMMGADICGFRGNTTVELCKRWMQLGAFYPFSRNHNSDTSNPQDPVSLGPEVVAASRTALRLRYKLLPYYYSLFCRAHLYGEPVVTPLFYDDPKNVSLYDIDDQFMIGPHVMVSPILQQDADTVVALFPTHNRWYQIRTGASIPSGRREMDEHQTVSIKQDADTVVALFPTHSRWYQIRTGASIPSGRREMDEHQTVSIKGGGIIPLQEPNVRGPVSTTTARSGPLQLLAAPDRADSAKGLLYWDTGDALNSYEEKKFSHIEFKLERNILRSNVVWWGYGVPSINNITVFNQPTVVSVSINGTDCAKPHCEFAYVEKYKVLNIFNINLALDKNFEVQWLYKAKENKAMSVNNSPSIAAAG